MTNPTVFVHDIVTPSLGEALAAVRNAGAAANSSVDALEPLEDALVDDGLESIVAPPGAGIQNPLSARDQFIGRLCRGELADEPAPVVDVQDGPVVVNGTKYVGRDAMIAKVNDPAAHAAHAAPLPGGCEGMIARINSNSGK